MNIKQLQFEYHFILSIFMFPFEAVSSILKYTESVFKNIKITLHFLDNETLAMQTNILCEQKLTGLIVHR